MVNTFNPHKKKTFFLLLLLLLFENMSGTKYAGEGAGGKHGGDGQQDRRARGHVLARGVVQADGQGRLDRRCLPIQHLRWNLLQLRRGRRQQMRLDQLPTNERERKK
jgi:hypothetical protein